MKWALGLCLAAAACSTDVSLGRRPLVLDGGTDTDDVGPRDLGSLDLGPADANEADAGRPEAGPSDAGSSDAGPNSYDLLYFSTPDVNCVDGWAGQEDTFAGVPPVTLGLTGGAMVLEALTSSQSGFRVSGPPILQSFGVAALDLLEQVPDLPAGYYGAAFALNGPGPQGLAKKSGVFILDTVSAPPPPYQGLGGVEIGDLSGSCFLSYSLSISPR